MIYLIDLDTKTHLNLIRDLPLGSVKHFRNSNKAKPTENDLTIFYNFHERKHLQTLKGTIYPNKLMAKLCEDRIDQLTILDQITSYPAKRDMFKNLTKHITTEPDKIYKVGNNHQGKDKYTYPETKKFSVYHENLIIEEFINGRSIRVLFIGNKMFMIEQTSEHKIKNIDPEEFLIEPIKELKDDAEKIKNFLDENNYISPTIGLDYVYSENKSIFLELNDMCGFPDELQKEFESTLKEICFNHVQTT